MLKAAPDAVTRQNIDGETALHLACGASSEEVQELIIESCPGAAGMVDNDGETPLHLAVIGGASLSVICQLVKANPYTVMRPNHRNRTPFDNLRRSYKNARSSKQLEDNPLDMLDDYQKALLFLRVAAWCCGVFLSGEGSGEGSEIPHVLGPPAPLFLSHVPRGYRCLPLHVVSWIACPRALVKALVTFHSDQCLVLDSFGSTPLCLAAAASTREDPEEYEYAEESGDEGSDPQTKPTQSVMNILLTANRKAAAIPNIQGRLPLAIALENGKTFDEVLPLIQAFPSSLVIKDPTTDLYPFMTAAAVIPPKRHPSLLNTVFDLLRLQPDLVMG
jgi:hypothetical protein